MDIQYRCLFADSARALLVLDPKDATFDLCDSCVIIFLYIFFNFQKVQTDFGLFLLLLFFFSMDFQ